MKEDNRFSYSLMIVSILHFILIFGVTFSSETAPQKSARNLDVIIIKNRTAAQKPEQADFISQSNQQGGGENKQAFKPKAPNAPPAFDPTEDTVPTLRQFQQNNQQQQQKEAYITQQQSAPPVKKVDKTDKLNKEKVTGKHKVIASIEREIVRLSAEIDKKRQLNAKKLRHKVINASTKESIYAEYLDQWRQKVEQIGNLNYPDIALQKRLYGSLILHVAVRSNGHINQINIIKSSGIQILDDAAIRSVREAAPFSPFPKKIRQQVDILDINRTWTFKRTHIK